MAKPDYTKLDELIVAAVRGGATQFWLILTGDVSEESERLVRGTKREPMRVVDGRLQALRRRGELAWNPKAGWHAPDRDNSATVRAGASEFSRSGSSQAAPSLTANLILEQAARISELEAEVACLMCIDQNEDANNG